MSYYLMDGINKNSKNEVNKFEGYINKIQSKLNRNSNNRLLNTFLSLQVSSNKIKSNNNINYINTPYNILKNSFSDKIKKKMNNINTNKNYKNHNYKIRNNNYVNLEFFEESKQDSFLKKHRIIINYQKIITSLNQIIIYFIMEKTVKKIICFFLIHILKII